MGRIQKAYESRFRALLGRVNARRADQGVQWLVRRAEAEQGIDAPEAFARVYLRTLEKIDRWVVRRGICANARVESAGSIHFLCDAGLGGLARWLRAAGYAADWSPRIGDAELLREADRRRATVVTADGGLLERRLVRDGSIPCVWVPSSMKVQEQLVLVLSELCLPLGDPRCMNCGGILKAADKESVRDRIPPRTYRWRDEYFLCQTCGQLFWRGTHWQPIQERLRALRS